MKINDTKVTFGTDFEVFIRELTTNRFVPARYVTTGTKTSYEKIEGGSIHADGLAVELGIDPKQTPVGFTNAVQKVLAELRRRCDENGWYISQESTIQFTPEEWATFSEDEIEVGCNPDFSIYLNKAGKPFSALKKEIRESALIHVPNPNPNSKLGTIRTVGGHLHIGWTNGVPATDALHTVTCKGVVRNLDLVFSTKTEHSPYGQDAIGCVDRVAFYGGFGCYRPKSYGVEYRAPDSRWLLDPLKCRAVMNAVQRVLSNAARDKTLLKFYGL